MYLVELTMSSADMALPGVMVDTSIDQHHFLPFARGQQICVSSNFTRKVLGYPYSLISSVSTDWHWNNNWLGMTELLLQQVFTIFIQQNYFDKEYLMLIVTFYVNKKVMGKKK